MKRLHLDLETYSPEPIGKTGLYKYVFHPDFRILLMAYAVDDEPVRIIDLARGEKVPWWLLQALEDPYYTKVAHNAAFERVCLDRWLHRRHDPMQWHCTMVQASRCGLPLSLAEAGAALGLEKQKMTEGKTLIKIFCTPKPARKGLFQEESGPVSPDERPDDWQTFKDYCVRDVEVERQIDKLTSWYPVSDEEQQLYAVDQRINDRGVLIDLDMVNHALMMDAAITARLNEEAMRLTGLSNPNSVVQLKGWLSEMTGQTVDTLTKKDHADLKAATTDPRVRRVIQIRAEMGKTSCAKYEAMKTVACADGRARGLTQFCGARTGRWSGRLIQMQNLPQNHIPDLEFARNCVKNGDMEMIELGWGNVPDVLSQLIRTAFVAPENKVFAVCDFSAIEARVLAWIAHEDWVLDVFRSGGDIYCETASQMFHVPVEKHGRNAELRQKGKIAVLALGYGGGVGALDAMGGQRLGMSEEEEKETVNRWRKANPRIVQFWDGVEEAAFNTVDTRERSYFGDLLFRMEDNDTMTIQLPSGRMISYPHMSRCLNRFGKPSLRYKGVEQQTNKWVWLETHGGKLTENIVQAIARDCLAHVLLELDKVSIPVVFHVHDEVICEVPSEDYLSRIEYCFSHGPEWAEGLPLKGAGYTGEYYYKD